MQKDEDGWTDRKEGKKKRWKENIKKKETVATATHSNYDSLQISEKDNGGEKRKEKKQKKWKKDGKLARAGSEFVRS